MKKSQVHINQFIGQVILVVTINLLIKPLYIFGIDVGVFNAVGSETYGLYWTLFNFVYLFSIISDLGLQQYNNRFISQSPQLISKYLPKILGFKLLLSLIFTTVVIVVGLLFNYVQLYPMMIGLLILNQILDSLFIYLRSNIAGLGKYTQDSLLSIVDKVFMILIVGAYLVWWREDLTIYVFIIAQTASFIIANAIAFLVMKNHLDAIIERSKKAFTFSLFRASLPYAVIVFLMLIYMRIDVVMLEKLHVNGELEVGKYAAEYRLLDAVNMVGYMIASLLLPMYARNLSLNKSVVSFAVTGLHLLMLVGIGLGALTFLFGQEISDVFFTESTAGWGLILMILMWTFIPRSIDYIFGTLLVADNQLKNMNRVYIAATLLNIVLNFFLIPKYGAVGAAITTLFCQLVVAVALSYLADRLVLNYGLWGIWKHVLYFAIVMAVITIALNYYQSTYDHLHIIIKTLGIGFITLCVAYFTGILDLSQINRMLRNKLEA